MKIMIKSSLLELAPSIKQYIEEKFNDLDRFLEQWKDKDAIEARVEVARTTKHHYKGDVFYAEINLSFPGNNLRAEATTGDIYNSIDEIHNDIKRQLRKYRTGRMEKIRKGARKIKEWIKGI
jgi:putative sigma-54 modulation protein